MNSETAAQDSSKASSSKSLVFDQHSVINATVYSGNLLTYSTITSKSMSRTDICDIPGQRIVATIKRRELLPDTVKFPSRNEGHSIAVSKWLRPVMVTSHPESCTSLVTDSGKFIWKTNPTYRLALFPAEDPEVPLAFAIRTRPPESLALTIKEECDEMMEDILISFIILEHRLRMKEKRRQNSMMFGPLSSGLA
ncbi:hypothetical protein CPB84DRAFT_1683406 [Gymnopilus junonius]|uniref:DUF6593 domain-containing protein n=1 Tax=Gymnopilus junonius TaxID=109634 RepID=A0A9P5NJU4_GYMJU|nr:hypothetical protein CPB84DRAFT_1683406 [Gymnopilus junonius]